MRAKRRAARLQEKHSAEMEEADSWFAQYANSKSSMGQEEVRTMLTCIKREAVGDPTAEVKPEILDQCMRKYGSTGDQIDREEIVKTVRKYKKYLAKHAEEDELKARSHKLRRFVDGSSAHVHAHAGA